MTTKKFKHLTLIKHKKFYEKKSTPNKLNPMSEYKGKMLNEVNNCKVYFTEL